MPKHVLILGGARSGKSSYAERLLIEKQNSLRLTSTQAHYFATAEALDHEMEQRIGLHKQDRQQHELKSKWQTHEVPLHLGNTIQSISDGELILIDCLTIWLSNCLHHNCWTKEKSQLINALNTTKAHVVLVSNEVGQGIVPMGELSRTFVDESGWLHQELATVCNDVFFITAGLAQKLK